MAVCASLVTHFLVLWAILPHLVKTAGEPGAISVSLFDGTALAPAKATVPPKPVSPASQRPRQNMVVQPDIEPLPVKDAPPPIDPTAEPTELAEPTGLAVSHAVAAAAVVAPAGDPCALGEWLQSALQADPAVRTALAGVPRSARSVANAVMLWNGAWANPPANAETGMATMRNIVTAGVAAAPLNCQVQPITGPVLITLGSHDNATILAIGSGHWRWQDLLNTSSEIQ